ncbi:hypothetical protein [Formosa sp. L2A11]|uniref:HTH-like domain-containing protein n=1 Tax=Formosa sp. L2A11 TaxID=2686363 RepID=UPI00131E8243|nr:hypothetical protein [Formosa sp. L2A11]
MTLLELGSKLRENYDKAQKGNKALAIYLFGIQYAKEIRGSEYSILDILKQANLPKGYNSIINASIKLSDYVTLNK